MRKNIILVIVLLLCFHSVIAAPSIPDPIEIGAEMTAKGMMSFVKSIADMFYETGNFISDSGTMAVFKIATYSYHPGDNEALSEMHFVSAMIYLVFMCMYIISGLGVAVIQTTFPSINQPLRYVFGSNYSSATLGYIKGMVVGGLFGLFVYVGIELILGISHILTSLIMLDVLDSITPTSDNVILYLMMGITYFVMCIFFAWRTIVIGICYGCALVIGCLYVFKSTRGIAKRIINYSIALVFMQPIIVLITAAGVIVIEGIGDTGVVPTTTLMFWYCVLMLMLVVVGCIFTLGWVRFKSKVNDTKNILVGTVI